MFSYYLTAIPDILEEVLTRLHSYSGSSVCLFLQTSNLLSDTDAKHTGQSDMKLQNKCTVNVCRTNSTEATNNTRKMRLRIVGKNKLTIKTNNTSKLENEFSYTL